MSFVLDLQVKSVHEETNKGPASLSFLSPVSCWSTTSVVLC
ncbi:SapB/AmfS family lanthipeptide [Microbispora sp. NPDC088329]